MLPEGYEAKEKKKGKSERWMEGKESRYRGLSWRVSCREGRSEARKRGEAKGGWGEGGRGWKGKADWGDGGSRGVWTSAIGAGAGEDESTDHEGGRLLPCSVGSEGGDSRGVACLQCGLWAQVVV